MSSSRSTPRHILFATDLSARSDRARERALMLARQWGCDLTVVHALDRLSAAADQRSRPSLAGAKDRALQILETEFRAFGATDHLNLTVLEGSPADVIVNVSNEFKCDFVVMGIASNKRFGASLSDSIARVSGTGSRPVLIVKARAENAYSNVIVATEYSPASIEQLRWASNALYPAELGVFHAYSAPYSGLVEDAKKYKQDWGREMARSIDQHVKEAESGRPVNVSVVEGSPGPAIADFVAARGVNLVIIGNSAKSSLTKFVFGSATADIVENVSCDILIGPRVWV